VFAGSIVWWTLWGMDIFFVVEFAREAAVTAWSETALGLLVLGCIGALVDV